MKHIKRITAQRPRTAQIAISAIVTALSQILQVVGMMLVEKQEMTMDPYDY